MVRSSRSVLLLLGALLLSGTGAAAGSTPFLTRESLFGQLKVTLVELFESYEDESLSQYRRHLAAEFRGRDALNPGRTVDEHLAAVAWDFRNLDQIRFRLDVYNVEIFPGRAKDRPRSSEGVETDQRQARVDVRWDRRARLQIDPQEWTYRNGRSILTFSYRPLEKPREGEPPGTWVLSAIDGNAILGLSTFFGELPLDRGELDLVPITTPLRVDGGRLVVPRAPGIPDAGPRR